MEALERHERHEMAHHHGQGKKDHAEEHHGGGHTKLIAVLIMVLAALLALCEVGAKSSQNAYLAKHIEASNLWAFFQAKTIRMTVMRTAAEDMEVRPKESAELQAAIEKKIKKFLDTATRYDDEPETGEGRKQLAARAKAAEEARDLSHAKLHMFEYGSAAYQLAIVLASAAVITGIMALAWVGGVLGGVGAIFAALGAFAPTFLHL